MPELKLLITEHKTFIRFCIVGIVNTLFGVGLYTLFIYIGLPYWISTLLSTILGILFNFKTIGTFVFQNKNNRIIIKFIFSYLIAYFINIFLIYLFLQLNFIKMNEYIAGILSTPFVAIISYNIQKRFVFQTKRKNSYEEKN
ncbi:MAG: GtrA family protein [Bacteroides sp.]|nr:GtrA family protein [Bacteroides sp.]